MWLSPSTHASIPDSLRAMCGGKKWRPFVWLIHPLVLSTASYELSLQRHVSRLDPHIMTRTSSHEPNQLIHGPHPTPAILASPLCKATLSRTAAQYYKPTFHRLITCSSTQSNSHSHFSSFYHAWFLYVNHNKPCTYYMDFCLKKLKTQRCRSVCIYSKMSPSTWKDHAVS